MRLTAKGEEVAINFLRSNLKPEYAEMLDNKKVRVEWFKDIENGEGHFELRGQYTETGNPVVTSFYEEDGEVTLD